MEILWASGKACKLPCRVSGNRFNKFLQGNTPSDVLSTSENGSSSNSDHLSLDLKPRVDMLGP